jgi:hypothetical protein
LSLVQGVAGLGALEFDDEAALVGGGDALVVVALECDQPVLVERGQVGDQQPGADRVDPMAPALKRRRRPRT